MTDPSTDQLPPSESPLGRFRRAHFKRMLVTGLVILLPVTLTVYILKQIFDLMDGIFSPVIDSAIGLYFPGAHVPGLGFLLTLLLVLFLGWLSTNVVGKRLIQMSERLICRIPVAKSIYSATKGVLEAVSTDQAEAFKRVVLIEYPKANIFALAFVTRWARWPSVHDKTADLLLVFVPTTPNPTSGFLLLVPRSEAIDLPISVEEGVRMVISGGILIPKLPDLPLGSKVHIASKHT
ncbi:MAG: DUF502 domain-containing protein [Acidobacteriota bacterium]